MKKELIYLIMALCFASCGSSPIDRANDLAKCVPFDIGEITSLDSIIDYPESFDYELKAVAIRHDADSILKSKMLVLQEMKEKGMTEEMDLLARHTKERVTNLIKTAYEYENDANFVRFKNDATGNENKMFVGYKYICENDSCKYIIYFDSEVSKIIGIDKKDK